MKKITFFIVALIILGIVIFWLLYCGLEIDLGQSITISVLAITALVVAIQSLATKELVESEVRPAVEVSMLCNNEYETRFQFLRIKMTPTLVYVNFEIRAKMNEKWKKINVDLPIKLTGKEPFRVVHEKYGTMYYEFMKSVVKEYPTEEIEASIGVSLAPIFNEGDKFPFFIKYYRLDRENHKWLDTCWSIPDPSFFE